MGCSDYAMCEVNGYSKVCKCKPGYIGDGKDCKKDPCTYCSEYAKCEYGTCKCRKGYEGDGKYCEKPDPCDKCDANALCKNTYGGKVCVCKDGYEGDGETCTKKVDPCEKCSEYANCVTKGYGIKVCVCKKGYEGDGFNCKKEDPCKYCPADTKCYAGKCVCKDNGYSYGNNKCNDKDECADSKYNNCHKDATCTNTKGGFKCKCNPGFVGDGVSCKKYDPCGMCSKYADCVVNGYQRQCKCKKGYYGNGQVCDKKDIEYPKPNPYPNGSNLNTYIVTDGQIFGPFCEEAEDRHRRDAEKKEYKDGYVFKKEYSYSGAENYGKDVDVVYTNDGGFRFKFDFNFEFELLPGKPGAPKPEGYYKEIYGESYGE